jgi:hypothetical protein
MEIGTLGRIVRSARILIALICISVPAISWGQITTVEGHVRERGTREAVVFAHIFLKDTHIGAITDTTGYFRLVFAEKDKKVDTLIVTYLGYTSERVAIGDGSHQTIEIILNPKFEQLQEVVAYAGENPAWKVLDLIVANKRKNNPERLDTYYCEEYSKIRFDLNHFTDRIQQNFLLRPFDYIWENTRTTEDGIKYLPVLLVEKNIEHYYQRSPGARRDLVNGVKTTGLAGPKIMQFVEDLYLSPNIYDDFAVILEKSFPSPINDHYKNHYEHYLMDSLVEDGHKIYRIVFDPKVKHSLAFTGEMLVDSATYGIKSIDLRFDIMANINFVRSYYIRQQYDRPDGEHWVPIESSVIGDFTVIENSADLTGFFGRKNSTYQSYRINQPIPKQVFKGAELVIQEDSADMKTDAYWEANRLSELTDEDVGIFNMVDQLEKDPKFIIRKDAIVAIATGYIPVKKLDIGDIYSFYSYNVVEHNRLKFGFRTSNRLSGPFRGSIYGAYGNLDDKWKYGFDAEVSLGKQSNKELRFGVSARDDISQLGRSPSQIELDNILTSFIQYGDIASRNYVRDMKVYSDKLWGLGTVTRLEYFNSAVGRTKGEKFYEISEGSLLSPEEYKASGVGITFKYSWQNPDVTGDRYKDIKRHVFRKFPEFTARWQWADKDLFGSGLDFHKFDVSFLQRIHTGKFGYLKYYIESGLTSGTVPYPFLNIPFGNQLVLNDEFSFNLMNFLEYAADRYLTVQVEQHLEGLLFNHIPGINKLKWRLFCFGRAYWGDLSEKNNESIYLFPSGLQPLTQGYYEVGFGIENIFKISRVDFTWRLTEGAGKYYYFLVKPSFKLSF